jgi:predicted dehydrogenase
MKHLLQDLANGQTMLADVPVPVATPGTVVIRTTRSLISVGTERMLIEFGKASLLQKARQQPERVLQVLEKVRTDGLVATAAAVRSKLTQPITLGYCNTGVVVEVGAGVDQIAVGDRVASNGPHAEYVRVPSNLCARVPDSVGDDSAAFTVLGSIALQGIRLAAPTLGETFAVIGTGVIGLLAVQILLANGCRVLAVDFDSQKLQLARRFGAAVCHASEEDPVAVARALTAEQGVDGVIIAASARSSGPVSQAARMSRKRARIVLIGVVGLELSRSEFYEKELTFQVSCSYGPGRYDPAYEEGGTDYPLPFVRWTEQRNFAAVLELLASGRLDVASLVTHRFEFEQAAQAYDAVNADSSTLGALFLYPCQAPSRLERSVALGTAGKLDPAKPVVGMIGAGNYAARVLIPALRKAGAQLLVIAAPGGTNAAVQGRTAHFAEASSDVEGTLANPNINTIVIATRHDSHAELVQKALRLGKNVFVEKPLAIREEEVAAIRETYAQVIAAGSPARLMVGFNRRFAPHMLRAKELLRGLAAPKVLVFTVNASALPRSHWAQDPQRGGGRIVGEACHFIDLARFIAETSIVSLQCRGTPVRVAGMMCDTATITLGFADGSLATIHYLSNGASAFPKERLEVFCAGRVLQLDNFRVMRGYGFPAFRRARSWRQDKGQEACAKAFLESIEHGRESPIPFDQLTEVASISIRAAQALQQP